MNDFTKEELLGLLYIISNFNKFCEGGNKTHILYKKIQSLIDNYQEPCPSGHEFYEKLVCHQCGHEEDF